jgi:DNA-binding LacI/PurR family transcriptional regulator
MRVEPFWLGPGGQTAAATCRMLHARAIHGNLITPFPRAVYDHELDWARMICVGLGYAFNHHALHRATHNHFRGAFTAYERLVKLGYRRIGLILDQDENRRVNYTWLGGYLAGQNTFEGVPLEPLLTYSSDSHNVVDAWLHRTRPDAVVGFGPRPFLTLCHLGYRIPADLAYAALDVAQMHIAHVESVAGINQNLPLIGATAIDILASQLYHNEQGLPQRPVFSMIEGNWVDGKTAPALS